MWRFNSPPWDTATSSPLNTRQLQVTPVAIVPQADNYDDVALVPAVKHSRVYCEEPDCGRQASFGPPGATVPTVCSRHKEDDSWNLSNRVCQTIGCQVTANYGNLGEKPRFCANHKDPDMINR
jgi:EsV-1-7 cysteine-rich motif